MEYDASAIGGAEGLRMDVLHGGLAARVTAPVEPALDDAVVLAGRLDHGAAFLDGEADGLLDIDVLAGLAGPDGLQSVPVIRRGDGDGVDVLVLNQLAEVDFGFRAVALEFLDLGDAGREKAFVDVTQMADADVRNAGELVVVRLATRGDADDGQVDPVIGAVLAPGRPDGGRGCDTGANGCVLDEGASASGRHC